MLTQFHYDCFSNYCLKYYELYSRIPSFTYIFNKYLDFYTVFIRFELVQHQDYFKLVYNQCFGLI